MLLKANQIHGLWQSRMECRRPTSRPSRLQLYDRLAYRAAKRRVEWCQPAA